MPSWRFRMCLLSDRRRIVSEIKTFREAHKRSCHESPASYKPFAVDFLKYRFRFFFVAHVFSHKHLHNSKLECWLRIGFFCLFLCKLISTRFRLISLPLTSHTPAPLLIYSPSSEFSRMNSWSEYELPVVFCFRFWGLKLMWIYFGKIHKRVLIAIESLRA